ncbi:MAG: hypothetical protein HOM84_03565 [Thiotrichales bacterium]|jgi:cytochrome c5|nr:hypothetical protein [Thiotrichales bacterium]MBT3752935.1 hypothetical protein [Thiotrichales bacterium]MBT3837579.1 hypothetical protein [Thiotrichales bacterium]MBT4261379.1 hypothetical protein [Thiotrichales bacterium]MBT4971613.1 hypothetical protein [Thiotrichales bacterium]
MMKKIINVVAVVAGVVGIAISMGAAASAESDYLTSCNSCHTPAVAPALQAPGLGDKAAWAPRIAKGMDALYDTAFNGSKTNPVMMPRGGSALSDDALKAVVDYMVSKGK